MVTKIHPFWTVYLNGLTVAIAEALEPTRSPRAHSYRFVSEGEVLFSREASWRAFRLETMNDARGRDAIIVQTDISSFDEDVYHHRLDNRINDLFPSDPSVSIQVDRILNRLASGRSFGLPVGGEGHASCRSASAPIDQQLDEMKLEWRRYVDDFVIVTPSHADAYRAVCSFSRALARLRLNTESDKDNFSECEALPRLRETQLGTTGDDRGKLLEIDLHFDPYSDDPDSDFKELRRRREFGIARLLDL